MEKSEYQNMYSEEETHFYYVSLHRTILSLIKRYTKHKKNLQILDAGCGTGQLCQLMQRYGKTTGIDTSSEALKFAKKRNVTFKKGSVTKIPFSPKSFDIVTSIDVIVSKSVDDTNALQEFYRVLKPGGILILRVSAIPWLQLSHDRFVHSNKRYTKTLLENKLKATRFKIEKLSYTNMFLAPAAIFQHIYEKILQPSKDRSSIREQNKVINNIATSLLTLEGRLSNSINLPFGLGLIAVCRKI